MKDNVAEFLLEFKNMEQNCRAIKGKEVREIEEELGEGNIIKNKLQISRQLRNFCSHNDYSGFIQIHKGMIKFLKEFNKSLKPKTSKTSKVKNTSKSLKSSKSSKSNRSNKSVKSKKKNKK